MESRKLGIDEKGDEFLAVLIRLLLLATTVVFFLRHDTKTQVISLEQVLVNS